MAHKPFGGPNPMSKGILKDKMVRLPPGPGGEAGKGQWQRKNAFMPGAAPGGLFGDGGKPLNLGQPEIQKIGGEGKTIPPSWGGAAPGEGGMGKAIPVEPSTKSGLFGDLGKDFSDGGNFWDQTRKGLDKPAVMGPPEQQLMKSPMMGPPQNEPWKNPMMGPPDQQKPIVNAPGALNPTVFGGADGGMGPLLQALMNMWRQGGLIA